MVFDNTAFALVGNVLVALLGVEIIFPQAPALVPEGWLGILLAIVIGRWWLKRSRDRRATSIPPNSPLWTRRLLAITTLNGAWWGVFCILLFTYASPLQVGFAPFVIGGMVAASVATLGPLRSVYLGFTLPMIACLIGSLLWHGSQDAVVMTGFAVAFEITMIGTVWRVNNIVGRNIELKLQNEHLVRSLTAANQSLQHEIVERRHAEERSAFLATHDALTGLPNRRMQLDRFGRAAARVSRHGGTLAVLFLDLDRFKEVNDTLGHTAGDTLLKAVSNQLRACLRQGDSICRQGGDEFLLLLTEAADESAVASVAERILESLQRPIQLAGREVRIGCSIGISLYPHDGDSFDLVVGRADKALYRAKRDGGNRYRFFATELDDIWPAKAPRATEDIWHSD